MAEAYEHPRFTNAATHVVALTVTVAGGTRPGTAHRRAETAAGRIVSAAARLADVVDVHALAGPADGEGQLYDPRPVRFAAANSGRGTAARPGLLDRYLDPDHERTLASLQQAFARERERDRADRRRRRAVGCANVGRVGLVELGYCRCVYCVPQLHLDALPAGGEVGPSLAPRCICGVRTERPGQRCATHQTTPIVVCDDDPDILALLADLLEVHP